MKENLVDVWRFVRFLVMRFRQERCQQMAASLTFTTLLSLVPLITIMLTLFSAFPVFDDFSTEIKRFLLTNLVPETGGKVITRYMTQFAESAAKLTAVGSVFLMLTAMLMMLTIDTAFNMIWRVSRPRPLIQRILIYWAALTLAPLLIGGSLSLTSWLAGVSAGYARQAPDVGVAMLKVLPAILTTLAFSLLFRVVPNRYVPLSHAVTGGVTASLAFEAMNRAFAHYITHFPAYKLVYGAFASIPIFLLWIYLSWITILTGALIAASLSHWRGSTTGYVSPAMRLYFALRILKQMNAGLQDGTVQTFSSLSRQLNIGFDSLEEILEKLVQADMVRKLAGNGWAVVRDSNHVMLVEIYRLFAFDSSALSLRNEDASIRNWLDQIDRRIAENSAATLHDLHSGTSAFPDPDACSRPI